MELHFLLIVSKMVICRQVIGKQGDRRLCVGGRLKSLRGRGTESEEVIRRRLEEAENEIKVAPRYRYRVVNDDLDRAVEEVLAILHGQQDSQSPQHCGDNIE